MPNNTSGITAEREFSAKAKEAGWSASKRGWPDFILTKGRNVVLVEVKSGRRVKLSAEQRRVAMMLAAAGLPVLRWDPEDGLRRIESKAPVSKKTGAKKRVAPKKVRSFKQQDDGEEYDYESREKRAALERDYKEAARNQEMEEMGLYPVAREWAEGGVAWVCDPSIF